MELKFSKWRDIARLLAYKAVYAAMFYEKKMNAFGYAREREQLIENARVKCRNWRKKFQSQLSNFSHNFPSSFILSNFSQNFPTAAKLSNFSETFQLKKSFQLRWVLSNFARFFPTSLGSFQLRPNFPTSDFPT